MKQFKESDVIHFEYETGKGFTSLNASSCLTAAEEYLSEESLNGNLPYWETLNVTKEDTFGNEFKRLEIELLNENNDIVSDYTLDIYSQPENGSVAELF